MTGCWVGKDILFAAVCLTFAHAYTIPLTNPMMIADTLPNVTGALKKTKPLTAIGSLFRAPTMEYVVEDVTRMHQAEQYDMKIVPRPEYTIPIMRLFLVSRGKFFRRLSWVQFSKRKEQMKRTGMVSRLL